MEEHGIGRKVGGHEESTRCSDGETCVSYFGHAKCGKPEAPATEMTFHTTHCRDDQEVWRLSEAVNLHSGAVISQKEVFVKRCAPASQCVEYLNYTEDDWDPRSAMCDDVDESDDAQSTSSRESLDTVFPLALGTSGS